MPSQEVRSCVPAYMEVMPLEGLCPYVFTYHYTQHSSIDICRILYHLFIVCCNTEVILQVWICPLHVLFHYSCHRLIESQMSVFWMHSSGSSQCHVPVLSTDPITGIRHLRHTDIIVHSAHLLYFTSGNLYFQICGALQGVWCYMLCAKFTCLLCAM